ncbi:MAG: hypothetical protein ABIP19_15580 [Dermatophilaceae bacterium]
MTGYSVRVVKAANGAQVGALRSATAAATSLKVTGLLNGTAVRFQVRATNSVGTSGFSARSNAVTPATVPARPVIRLASSGAAGGTVNAVARWAPPAVNGGAAVTGYVVTAIRLNANGTVASLTRSTVRPAGLRSLTMTLRPGSYRFVVQARNRMGMSSASVRSNLVRAR